MKLTGATTINLVAHDKLKIVAADIEELKESVPVGKVWAVQIVIDITETDA